MIQDDTLFREEPGNTYTPVSRIEAVEVQRGPQGVKETVVLAVPLPDERKRRELDLAELMAETIEDILSGGAIGREKASLIIKAVGRAYPELSERSL